MASGEEATQMILRLIGKPLCSVILRISYAFPSCLKVVNYSGVVAVQVMSVLSDLIGEIKKGESYV